LLVCVALSGQQSQLSNEYILHTRTGDIRCTYHDSRQLNNGWMGYYDLNGEKKYVAFHKVDSVTIIKENWLFCGPKSEHLKYISKTKP
jgi:hypothetical protein